MKPRLMQVVYYKHDQDILKGYVYMKGRTSFCFVRYPKSVIRPFSEPHTSELSYDSYGNAWFTTLAAAKNAVIEEYTTDNTDHIEFEKIHGNVYLGYIYDKNKEK